MRACTIVARNYLAQARVLARSFARQHPESPFTILIVDDLSGRKETLDGIEILHLDQIGLDPADAHRMALIYDVTELATAVKPWLLRTLLARGRDAVLYFDPDIELFAPVDHIGNLAVQHSIVLTPHVTEPMPRDGLRLSESDILGSGIYNLGFIAIGPGSESFLDYWSVRLRRDCVINPREMRFTDQRWVDFVPGLYEHYILRDPTCNVAYWNLYSRRVVWTGSGYEVNGKPLTFYHFSGYNPDHPHVLSKHQNPEPRILLSEHPGVAKLCREYSEKLSAEGFEESKRNPFGFELLRNGIPLTSAIRQLYRAELEEFENGDGAEPPDPFVLGGEEVFLEWLNEPIVDEPQVVTRYMLAVHSSREDLQRKFPEPLDTDAPGFHSWYVEGGARQVDAPAALVPEPLAPERNGATPFEAAPSEAAVNVVGYLAAELGVGEAGRLLITALEAADTHCNPIVNRETLNRQTHPITAEPETQVAADINILCINADQTPGFVQRTDPQFFADRYCIGVWFWEVEQFPAHLHGAFDAVDEVWVATEFIRRTLQKVSPKPVYHLPLPIIVPAVDPRLTKEDLQMPGGFTFLFSFDFLSVYERKNPAGVITAFTKAFAPGSGASLMIKTINGREKILDLEKLRYAAADHPDIKVVDGYFSPIEKNTLTAKCDCLVSLHRSEGYGLTMAEAMALGKPVIATAYSGNVDFMAPENSFLCPYEMRKIGSGAEPYPADATWAAPDLDVAARLRREVYNAAAAAAARGARAAEDVRRLHSPAAAGKAMRARIDAIRKTRAGRVY